MTRFFFHVRHGATLVRDEHGCVLADAAEASLYAHHLSLSLLRILSGPELMKAGLTDFTVEVEQAAESQAIEPSR